MPLLPPTLDDLNSNQMLPLTSGVTALHLAAAGNFVETVVELLRHGANPNAAVTADGKSVVIGDVSLDS